MDKDSGREDELRAAAKEAYEMLSGKDFFTFDYIEGDNFYDDVMRVAARLKQALGLP